MEILEVDIEKYEELNDPTSINKTMTDWTIYETDLKNMREMKKKSTKTKRTKKMYNKIA